MKQYNNFSPELKSKLPVLKPGEKLRFVLKNVRFDKKTGKWVIPKQVSFDAVDRIWDPWAKDHNGQKKGNYVDIAYIIRELPASQDSPRDSNIEIGRIEFKGIERGTIEIIGGDRQKEKMLPFLFLSNRNSSNIGKDWHIKPQTYTYLMEQKAKDASDELKVEEKKDNARDLIKKMGEEELLTVVRGLFPQNYQKWSKEEKIMQLRRIADKNPDKILGLSQDVTVQINSFIEECMRAELIILDNKKAQFVWPDDRSKICSIKPGLTAHQSMKIFLMSENGKEVLAALEKQLELTKKPVKDKTATSNGSSNSNGKDKEKSREPAEAK